MIELDASFGEGGGQILRTALALSIITGQPVRLTRIRARRAKPGLKPQHLTAVRAAAEISRARVEGAEKDSQELTFAPQSPLPGNYRFDIGTAGSTTLLLQTILVPLSLAGGTSEITVTGGTHVPWSPCYHFLEWQWAPVLKAAGYRIELFLDRAGFYPKGGGIVRARVEPAQAIEPLQLVNPGKFRRVRGVSAVARLDLSIAERQRHQAQMRLARLGVPVKIECAAVDAISPGTFIVLKAEREHASTTHSALGAIGKRAERVADEAADDLLQCVASGVAVDAHLADQLILPLALARGRSEFTSASITPHLMTNAEVVRRFLRVEIEVEGAEGSPGRVTVEGRSPG